MRGLLHPPLNLVDRDMTAEARKPPREVRIVRPDYQPSRAELNEDARVDALFNEAVEALTKPVNIRYVDRPED